MICGRLVELESLIHHLLAIEEELCPTSSTTTTTTTTTAAAEHLCSLTLIMSKLIQTVWPALAVIGGVDSGFCLGRHCQVEKDGVEWEGQVVSTPNSSQVVELQEKVTARTTKITKKYVVCTISLIR